jgi:hypothetical protein
MAQEFATINVIQDELLRIDHYANSVATATANGFSELDSDFDLVSLAGYVSALKSYLERIFTDAFGQDGKALLDGTHKQYGAFTELIKELLDQHDAAWLPPRIAELEAIIARANAVLMEAPIIPVGDDHRRAAELREILEEERRGKFVSMYYEECCLGGQCRSCGEHRLWERLVQRMRRNLDRHEPEAAEARQKARRAATQRDYDAEIDYLESR